MEGNDFDKRVEAIYVKPKGTMWNRCKVVLCKMVLVVLSFTLAIFWTDTIRVVYDKYTTLIKGSVSYSVILSLVVTVITFILIIGFMEI
jgi:hypothetical protein